jgi:hypothetical protein
VGHSQTLRDQERSLEHLAAPVAAEPAARRDDAMARDIGPLAYAHDVAHGPVRAGVAGQEGDVAVRGDTAARNAADYPENTSRETASHAGLPYMSVRGSMPYSAGSSGVVTFVGCSPPSWVSHKLAW